MIMCNKSVRAKREREHNLVLFDNVLIVVFLRERLHLFKVKIDVSVQ